jgi:amidohydrolase
MGSIRTAAEQCFDEIVAVRRKIHRHPEIGRTEVETSKLIREKLTEFGVDKIETPVPTATVALIYGKKGPGKCVALRTDIDALPVQEQTGLPYASEVPNMMHACGHDMHASMMLGVAKILCGMRGQFAGTVKLIFQHSEDTLPGGAKELVEKGVMENPHVDAIFGMHLIPDESRIGKVVFKAGPLTTSVDLYDVTVNGKGGHGSTPQLTNDPVLAACQMVTLLQQIQSRRVDPLETVIFPVCTIHAGDAPNVIPSEAKFGGVARAYVDSVREVVCQQVYNIAKGVEDLSGCQIDINHYEGYPAVDNDKDLTALARNAVAAELGEDAVIDTETPFSFSEDFSYYTKMTGTPGAYFMVYAGHMGELVSLHNPKCAMCEEVMPYGMSAMASSAVAFLNS